MVLAPVGGSSKGTYRPGKLGALRPKKEFRPFFFACSEKKHAIVATCKDGRVSESRRIAKTDFRIVKDAKSAQGSTEKV